jgi:hypothetical protein
MLIYRLNNKDDDDDNKIIIIIVIIIKSFIFQTQLSPTIFNFSLHDVVHSGLLYFSKGISD